MVALLPPLRSAFCLADVLQTKAAQPSAYHEGGSASHSPGQVTCIWTTSSRCSVGARRGLLVVNNAPPTAVFFLRK